MKRPDGKPAAHACGHNLVGSSSVTAAIALSQWLKATGTPRCSGDRKPPLDFRK